MTASSWLEFSRDLLGTLIGAGVGLGLAMWWDRRKQQADRDERRARTLDSIHAELDRARDTFDVPQMTTAPLEEGAVELELSVPFLGAYAFEAAVHSGNLTLLSAHLQARLSSAYEQMRLARLLADAVTTFASKGLELEEELQYLRNNYAHLQGHLEMLSSEIDEIFTVIAAEHPASGSGATRASSP